MNKLEMTSEDKLNHARNGMFKKYIEDMSNIYLAIGQVLSKRGYKDNGILNFYDEMNKYLPEHLQSFQKEEDGKWTNTTES